MSYPKAQGKGRDGVVTIGDRVLYDGHEYTLVVLGGGRHQHAALKDDSGATTTCDTQDLVKKL